jgi:hypothetical protein
MNNVISLHKPKYYEAITSCDHCTATMWVVFCLEDLWLRCPNCGLETNTPDMRPNAVFQDQEEDCY